jgi:hypothetical protein
METNTESKLSLTNVFKANAVINFLSGAMMLLMGEMMFEEVGMTVTEDLVSMGIWTGATMMIMGIMTWKMPDWAGENLSDVGKFMAVFMCAWLAIAIYEVVSGKFTVAQNAMPLVGNALFAGLFYWKSQD